MGEALGLVRMQKKQGEGLALSLNLGMLLIGKTRQGIQPRIRLVCIIWGRLVA